MRAVFLGYGFKFEDRIHLGETILPACQSTNQMGSLLILLLAGLSAASLRAQLNAPFPVTMTRMVVRLKGPNIKPGSIAALPKTIYEASPHFARIEDPPDSRQKIQKVTVIAEPDAYSANLIDRTGTHARDTGSDERNDIHLPIVLPFDPRHQLGKLDRIEFGSEYDFFNQAGATQEPGPIVNAEPTDALRLSTPAGPAVLVLRKNTDIPVTLTWQLPAGQYQYEYIEYKDVPFNRQLFAKPAGIKFKEIRPDELVEPG